MDQKNSVSKTQRKREMTALQALGEQLVELDEERLSALHLPSSLLAAVLEAKRIKSFGALRRQLQYIGRLMRNVDAAPIRAQLDAWRSTSRHHTAGLHRVERWRERLLADEIAIQDFIAEFPAADLQQIRALIRNTHKERAEGKPPRSYRGLFQALREIIAESAPAAARPEDGSL